MKVKSKLADIDFEFGRFEYKKDHLIVHSHESQAIVAGVKSLYLGTDDETGLTSLSEGDLYENISKSIASIKNYRRHPYEFYQKCGFEIEFVRKNQCHPKLSKIFLVKFFDGDDQCRGILSVANGRRIR